MFIDRIKMGLSYYRFTGHIFQILMFIIFTLTNSADSDEMQLLWHCILVFTVCQSTHLGVNGLTSM